MRLSLGMEARQVQVQKLAPRMIQSMEILQLPLMALQERIEQEMSENPLLEMQDPEVDFQDDRIAEPENPNAPSESEKELVVDEKQDNVDDFERLDELDRELPDFFDESPRRSANQISDDADRRHDQFANIVARPESLQDHLSHQLGELELDPEVQELAERIISTLDPADGGYFRSSLEDLLPVRGDRQRVKLAREALAVVQSLDPPGIAARDLRECLLLQLSPGMPFYQELKKIISDHLEDLSDNRLPAISRKTGLSIEQIQATWKELRKLNPKPGAGFTDSFVPTVTPDVQVEKGDDGKYRVVVDETRTPQLRISKYYRDRLANGTATEEEREFIRRKLNAAQWLMDAIEQRRHTLAKVAQAIVDYQQRFLDEGPEYIEPLKMQQIAEQVGFHVTTISRAVDDKWIQTPRGILPLRRFFVGGTQSRDGDEVAWDTIRLKLQEVVDQEDKSDPYSDEQLVKQLEQHGLKVARRTITKYRQKMGIPGRRQRRDWTQTDH
jgi:RNA polymerase sigma-54 factor